LKRTSTALGFSILILTLNIWKDFKVLGIWAASYENPSNHPILLRQAGCMGTSRNLFPRTSHEKYERVNNFSLEIGKGVEYFPTFRNPNQNIAALWQIFSSNKIVQANRKKGFYTSRVPKKQKVGGFFVWSGSELWSLFF
jgi:hypothetical protein